MEAGWRFQRRKPRSAPPIAKQKSATTGWAMGPVRLIVPSVSTAMSATPDESPSSPSMKLMLLIMPRIQMTAKVASKTPLRWIIPGPNGLASRVTVMPSPTATPARISCPASCQRARRSNQSSRLPIKAASAAPPTSATTSLAAGASEADQILTTELTASRPSDVITKAPATAMPPPRGTGAVLTRRSAGWSRTSNRRAKWRTIGVRTRARMAAVANAARAGSATPSLTGSRLGQPRNGEAPADLADLGGDLRLLGGLVPRGQRGHDQASDLAHLAGAEPARRGGGRPDPDPGGDVGRVRVERDGVLVDRDPDVVEESLGFATGHPERRHVLAHEVIVRPAGDEPAAAGADLHGEHAGVLHRATLVLPERGRGGQAQGDRLRGDDVHEGPTLRSREDGLVHLPGKLGRREDEAAPGAAERLVGRGRDQVRVREGRRMLPGRDQPGDVRHVHEEVRPHAVGDLREALEVQDPRVRARPGDHELRADLGRLLLHRVVVDEVGLAIDAVGVDVEPLPAEVDRGAMGQMTAVGEAHPEDPVARREHREERGEVRRRARVGLDIDVRRAREQGEGAVLCQALHDVHVFAAAVVAAAGQALRVLVR